MNSLVSPPSNTVGSPRAGGRRRVGALAALCIAAMITVTSCTASVDNTASTLPADVSSQVDEFLEQHDEYDKVRAVLVYEDGAPALEMYRGENADDYLDLRSVTKSVVGTLIGIAIDEELISGVDATLGELLPEHREVMDAEVAAIPLENVLTHTAGFAGDGEFDIFAASDTVTAIIEDRVARGSGSGEFEYSDAGSHLLAAILDHATGGDVLDFARTHLFDPLGIESEPAWVKTDGSTPEERALVAEEYLAADFAWPVDAQGIHTGWTFMKLRPDDLAKLGLLYLGEGEWEGEPVVSSSWVQAATATHVDTASTPNGYGYQWWTHTEEGNSMFLAVGYGGNVIAVVPDRRIVIVIASAFDGIDALEVTQKFDQGEAINLVQYVILAQPD